MFKAAFALAFFGAYRFYEVEPSSKTWAGESCFTVGDLQLQEAHVMLRLRKLRVRQISHLDCITDPKVCPVSLLRRYLKIMPVG